MAKQLLMGNEAFAHAALEAGVRVVAGYPGTPSSELVETVAKLHAAGAAEGVHVEWSTNEKAALELLIGASYTGARCLFTCKQMGLNVASDPLLCVTYIGVKGGLVLFVADDPGPISSQTEQDTRRFASFAKLPVLDPSTPEQGFAMMKEAFELSERYHTPVIVRPTTRVNHASTFFDVAAHTTARPVPSEGFVRDPKWVIFPGRAYQAHGEINERLPRIAHEFSATPALAAFNPIFEGSACMGGTAAERHAAMVDVSHAEELPATASLVNGEVFGAEHTTSGDKGNNARQPKLGIMAGGVSAAYAREALHMLEERAATSNRCIARGLASNGGSDKTDANANTGADNLALAAAPLPAYRFMQVGTPYPFPEEAVAAFVDGLDAVLVLEELDHFLEDELLAYCGKTHGAFAVRGKLTGDACDRGENDVDDAACRLAAFLGVPELAPGQPPVAFDTSAGVPLPVRPPVLCAGCPHRGSFFAVKQALGKTPAVLCGDIGCYTLGNAQPLDAVDTCLCMGAGITMAQGLAVAEPGKKHVAFVGDSTFFASGLTGLVNAVYNGHDITVCVLDNATTAMTGSQPHPGTGVTLMGPKRPPVSIARVLEAIGFGCIVHANPLVVDEAVAAAREALEFAGPSAVLFEWPCIQLTRPQAPVSVNAALCTGCKQCITKLGCPGLGFDPNARGAKSGQRGQAFVDASLCNGCGLCTQLCPFGALGSGNAQDVGDAGGSPVAERIRDAGDLPRSVHPSNDADSPDAAGLSGAPNSPHASASPTEGGPHA